jgi:hypothetical protein
MGYTTDFRGEFKIDKEVDEETYKLLDGLNKTRRMARKVAKKYGVEGEFYVKDTENMGQSHNPNIIDYNRPPKTQPGLWCQWSIREDRKTIEWDGGEKFYEYIEWMKYLIEKILKPRDYVVNGECTWQGEEPEDSGILAVEGNEVIVKQAVTFYLTPTDAERVKKIINDYLSNPLKELMDHKIDKS